MMMIVKESIAGTKEVGGVRGRKNLWEYLCRRYIAPLIDSDAQGMTRGGKITSMNDSEHCQGWLADSAVP